MHSRNSICRHVWVFRGIFVWCFSYIIHAAALFFEHRNKPRIAHVAIHPVSQCVFEKPLIIKFCVPARITDKAHLLPWPQFRTSLCGHLSGAISRTSFCTDCQHSVTRRRGVKEAKPCEFVTFIPCYFASNILHSPRWCV